MVECSQQLQIAEGNGLGSPPVQQVDGQGNQRRGQAQQGDGVQEVHGEARRRGR